MRGGSPEAAGRLPHRPLGRLAAAARPTSTVSLEPARFGGRKRGPARPTRPTRPGPPPAPGAGCSGATVARPACLSRRLSPRAGASCLRGTRAGVEDCRRGEDFFFFFPSRASEGREEPAGGGEWWEPQGASGPQSAAGEGRAEGRREPVAFPEHLGAGSALRRRAGTCLLDEPALKAPEVPRSSRALPALPGFRLRAPGLVGAPKMGGAGSYNVCDGISVDARWGCLCICASVCH